MTPTERAKLVFSEHTFLWREGDEAHKVELVAKAIAGAVAAERAACANVAERWPNNPILMEDAARWQEKGGWGNAVAGSAYAIAAAIRSRSSEGGNG